MVKADTVLEELDLDALEFNALCPFPWSCYNCDKNSTTETAHYEPLEEYDRKGVVKCGNCGYKEVIHLYHEDEKRMNDAIEGEAYGIMVVTYWTGKHRVRLAVEEGPTILTEEREPRPHHPAFDETEHNMIAKFEKAALQMDLGGHVIKSDVGTPYNPEEYE